MEQPTALEVIDAITSKALELSKSLTVKDAAQFYDVHPNQVLRFAQSGLKCYKYGNKYIFTLQDLIAFRETFTYQWKGSRK